MGKQYNAGSVSARIELDTSQFDEAISDLKKQAEKAKQAVNKNAENTASAIDNLVNVTNKLKEEQSKLSSQVSNTSSDIKKEADALKQLSPQIEKNTKNVQNTIKANKDLKKSQDDVTKSLKNQEKQAKKTTAELQKQFNKDFLKSVKKQDGSSQILFKPIWNDLKKQYKELVTGRKQFERLMVNAISELTTGTYPKRDGSTNIHFATAHGKAVGAIKGLKKVKKETDKVTESNKKATEATKELTVASNDLEIALKGIFGRKQSYELKDLVENYEKLPLAVQTAVDGIRRSISKMQFGGYPLHGGYWSGNGGDLAEQLFMEEIEAWAKFIPKFNIDKLLKKVFPIKKMSDKLSVFDEMHSWDKWYGGISDNKSFGKPIYYPPYQIDEITGLKKTLEYLQELEITSRKTGEAVKTTTKSIEKETKAVKELGEATKQTNEQLQLEVEILNAIGSETYKYLTNLKRGRRTKGVVGTDTILSQNHKGIKGTFKTFDWNRYTRHMDRLFKGIIPKEVYEKHFSNFRQMYRMGEVSPFEGQGGLRRHSLNRMKDFEGLSSAKELKEKIEQANALEEKTIVQTEKLNKDLEGTVTQINKAVAQANQLATAIEKVGSVTKTTTNFVEELGLATDEFGFVYLGELISQFDRLPTHIQKAVSNVSRIIQKGKEELYPRNAMQEFQNDLGFASFDLLKNGIPFNIGDPRYFGDFRWIDNIQITMEQVQEQKALLDQILQTFGSFFPENYKKINDAVYGNNRFLREDLQYTLDTLKEMEILTKRISRYMDILRANRYGFLTGQDKYNKQYLKSTLNNGFDTHSRIMPLNRNDRAFTPSDKDFLKRVFEPILSYYDNGSTNRPIRSLFKYPAWKQLTTSDKINMPYNTEYMFNFDDTKEGYEEFIKWAHTRMRRALRLMNIELSKELSKSQEGVRVWFENLGKWQNMYSLDTSKTFPFKDIKEFQAYIDKVTTSMAYLGIGIDATAMKTTKLNYALRENVNWQQRVSKEQEKARIKAEQLANAKFPNLKVGVELWGTAEEFRRAEIGFRNLISILDNIQPSAKKVTNDIKQLGEAEETTAKSTDKLSTAISKLDLSGKTKYSLSHLLNNIDQLPIDYAKITQWLNDRNTEFSKGDFYPIRQLGFTIDDLKKGELSFFTGLKDFVGVGESDFYKIFDFDSLISDSEKLAKSTDDLTKSVRRLAEQYMLGKINAMEYADALMKLTNLPYENVYLRHLGGETSWRENDRTVLNKYFTRQKNKQKYVSIPYKTWEEIQQLPVTEKNWRGYGKEWGWGTSINHSPLDLRHEMYTYEELMKEFWRLPEHYQKELMELKKIIDKDFKGEIPKDFTKADIYQREVGTSLNNELAWVFSKLYRSRHPNRNAPSLMKYRPIKGIPIMENWGEISAKEVEQFYNAYDAFVKHSQRVAHSIHKNRAYETSHKSLKYVFKPITRDVKKDTSAIKQLGEAEEKTANSTEKLKTTIKSTTPSINQLGTSLTAIHRAVVTNYGTNGGYQGKPIVNFSKEYTDIIHQIAEEQNTLKVMEDEVKKRITKLHPYGTLDDRQWWDLLEHGRRTDIWKGSGIKAFTSGGETWYELPKVIKETVSSEKDLVVETKTVQTETEKLTNDFNKLGEASEHTATQIKILKEIMDWVNRTSKTNHSLNEGYINSGLYLGLENKYIRDITGSDMGSVINPEKLRRRFQREIKPLFDELQIGFEVATRGFNYPIMDFSNIISETEFKQLIGETDDLSSSLKKIEEAEKGVETETKRVEQEVNNLKVTLTATIETSVKDAGEELDVLATKTKKVSETLKELGLNAPYLPPLTSMTPEEIIMELSVQDMFKVAKEFQALEKEITVSTNRMGNAIKNVGEKTRETTSEANKLSQEYIKVNEKGAYVGISMYQAYSQIIPAVIRAREEVTKLGAKNTEVANWIGKLSKGSSPIQFFRLFKGQIKNFIPVVRDLETKAKNAFKAIEEGATKTREIRLPIKSMQRLPMVLEKVAESSKKAGESASESFKGASESSKKFHEEARRSSEEFYREQREKARRYYQEHNKMGTFTLNHYKNIFQQLNAIDARIEELYGRKINSRYLRMPRMGGEYNVVSFGKEIAHTTTALKTFDNTVLQVAMHLHTSLYESMKKIFEENKLSDEPLTLPIDNWKQALSEISAFELRYTALMQRMYNLSRGLGEWRNKGKENKGYGALLEKLYPTMSYFDKKLNKKVTFTPFDKEGSLGRIDVVGYSDYIAHITEIQAKLQEAKAPADHFKESLKLLSEALKLNANSMTDFVGKSEGVIASLTQMAQANERFAQQPTQVGMVSEIEKIGQVLNHFSSMSSKSGKSLSGLKTQLLAIKDSADVLAKSLLDGSLSQEQYEKELLQLSNRLKQLGEDSTQAIRKLNMVEESTNKTSDGFKKGQRSVREFGKTMGESERYADTLYRGLQKVRSIIISLKTIGRMMGTMEIWNFAFELIESAKETYVAKNEMESLLKQNSKISTSGIDIYNKALDETVSRFQKINKYSLGETGASIGLEFNLNAQEMAKSLPVIAMIQNEYVRAGRTVEEASLAVKDILQGEFMRLSRETGIGKEDLEEKYGWNGDKSDVLNLMKALEKAGKERHWDLFAEKATSLNDILTITQSRFSELGAELGTHAEPLIVGTFNTILGVVDALKTGFEGLGSFGKTMVSGGGIVGGFVALSSVYLALAKNMGFLDIATIGFNKSLATSILHLNKEDVVLHGFWKTLIATTSGTKVATIETIGLKKAIAGRLLGVKQSAIAEVGFKNALVGTISKYKEEIPIIQMGNKARGAKINLDKATSIVEGKLVTTELNRSQRLAYLTTKLKYNEVAELSRGKALLKSATSAKVLFNALKLVGTVGIIAYFASLVSWTDKVKSYVTGFYNVVDNGKTLIKDAKADIKANSDALTDINAKIDKYNSKNKDTTALLREKNGLLKDEKIAQQNLTNVQKANDLAKTASENLQNRRSRINTHHTRQLAEAYVKLGFDSEKATLEANNYYSQVKVGSYYANKALDEYDTRLTNATNHSLAHAQSLQKMGVDQDTVNQYMMDYNLIAEETAEHWRKFNEGDIWEGFSGLMGDLKLAWTDFTYTPEFRKLVDGLKDWYNWLKPSLETIIEYLKELGKSAIDAFSWLTSTDIGKLTLTVTTLGSVVAVGALKIAKWLTGAKSVGTVLKDLGGKLKDRIKDWKDYNDVTGDKKSSPDSKTDVEGKKNPNYRDKRYSGWGELGADIKQDTFTQIRKFAKYAVQLAGVMVLVTEAIILLEAPMFALAEVGKVFKAKEKSIKAGIEGIKIIAPIIVAFLVPIGLLMKVMDKWSTQLGNWKTWASTALGIAGGMLLVTEAIAMLIPPLWAMGALGDQYMGIKTQVKKGAEAMKLISESLIYLLPFVPAMVLGVALVDAMFTALPLGASALVIVAGGIALGMGLVAEAIWTLQAPLWAIGDIGKNFKDLTNVRQGAEALKLSAEALGYVAEGVASLAVIAWEDLVANIGRLVSQRLGISLTGLTGEGGFFDQLNTFMKEFNSDELQIEAPQPEKVQALASVGEGINTISSAMESVKNAMENIPDEFKNGGASLSYDMETDKTQVNTYDVEGYFDTFKEPLRQLKTFIEDFNTSDEFDFGDGINPSRVEAIQSAGNMLETLNNAVTQVKTIMQGIGDSQWNTAYAEGGILSAVGNFLFHQTGEGSINNGQSSGSYKSSIGSSLQEMENVISDLFTFQTNVNNLTGGSGEGTDVSGATAMVTTIQTAITNLATSLSDAIPTFEGKGNAISSAIVRGIKTGFSDLGATITNEITDAIDGAKDSAETYGKGLGSKLKSGFKDNLKIKDTTSTEVDYTFEYLDGKEQAFYDKGAMLGDALSRGFKEHKGLDQQSPGRIARTVHDELDYVTGFFQNGLINLPQMAMNLGNALSSNFNFDLGLGNLQLPDLSQFQQGLGSIIPMVTGVKDNVSLQFDTMKTNIGGAFSGILSNTKLNMGGMLSATTKNIGAIRTSWKGMQSALISSAEYIKTQTGQKIDKLKTNMGDFWNKIQHPDQLIGSAGGHQGTIRRRYGGSSMLKGLYAGGTSSPTPNIKFDLQKYLECMIDTGGNCYAGGWSFNWNKPIQSKFNGWNTHFGKYKIDDFVKVGKFADSNFPVKGIADIAKAYIFDTIRATDYAKYFNSNFGDDPVSALRAGAFNCWDGTNIILAIARAFGFEGSRGHGTWNGIGHVWANIPGLGIIDPTAIQNRGTFTSSAVKGYHAGGTTTRNSSTSNMNMGNTYGDINITINNNGKDMTIDEKKIDKETSKKIWDIINPSLNTGL